MIKVLFLLVFSNFILLAKAQKMKGVNLVSSIAAFDCNISKPLDRIGANYIALTPYLLMKEESPEVFYEVKGNYWGDYRAYMKKVIQNANKNGISVMLKPHIYVENVGWAGSLNFKAKDWGIWEANFSEKMLAFAKFAEENKIAVFCIGVELKTATARNPDFFKTLIKEIKEIYKGKLTYAANWDNYREIKFWKELDFIGIDGYFPISLKKEPTILEIERGWNRVLPKLKEFSKELNKKIIFTEFGYRSCDYSLGKQWEIEHNKDIATNFSNQNNGYEVFFRLVYSKDFIAGGFLWKWYGNEVDLKGLSKNNYTPQNKPVEKVIKKWYDKN